MCHGQHDQLPSVEVKKIHSSSLQRDKYKVYKNNYVMEHDGQSTKFLDFGYKPIFSSNFDWPLWHLLLNKYNDKQVV